MTMNRTLINEVPRHVGQKIKVCGFAKRIRDQKAVQFLIIRDHTGVLQAVVERNESNRHLNDAITRTTTESAIEVEGIVVENPKVNLGGMELQISSINIVSLAGPLLPIDFSERRETTLDPRLDWRFLDLRQPRNLLIFKVQTLAEMAMREFWMAENFIEIHSPKLMGHPSETGAELFEIKKYFELPYACLAQSPQFYKQMGMAAGFDRLFEIGPVFRANPSFTARHDTEFTSVDVEISWIASHHEIMELEARWIQHVLARVKNACGDEIKKEFGVDVTVPSLPFPKVTMADAIRIVKENGYELARSDSYVDLDPPGERIVCEHFRRQTGHEFVFVIDYPAGVRPFYHMRHDDNPALTKSFDLLWKGLEVTTGAQREHRYDALVSQVKEKKMRQEPLQFYLDFFKYGCPPHGGYGFGLTRMLMVLLNLKNVREVTYLYRGPNRLTP
jgi:aspartyl-tRNA synthetase